MIRPFRHAGLEKFYRTDSKAGIQPHHARKLRRLQGGERQWSIRVKGNYRLTFTIDGEDAILLDYRDYH
jgi:proteic killer suppression protein